MASRCSLFLGAIAVGLLRFAAAGAQPAPAADENVATMTATVKAIDVAKRLVELRSGHRTTTVAVPTDVRNLGRVRVGDEVIVRYYEGVAAEFKEKEEAPPGAIERTNSTSRSQQGDRSAMTATEEVATTVVIEAVDRATNSVTFTGPAGMTRTVQVKDPRAQAFIAKLGQGDEVELVYTEAVAVSVEPKPPTERRQR